MEFTNKAPEWNAEGAKPTEDLINQGFTAGYKPPADYFNYMFNQYKKSIDETQEAVNTLDDNLSNYVTKENPTLYSATSKGTSIKVKNSEGDTCPLHLNGNGVYADEEGYAFYAEEFYEAGKKLDKIYATKDELATVETTMTDEYAKKYNTRLTGTTYIDDGIVAAEEETDMEGESVYTQKGLWLNGNVFVSADGKELDAEVLKQAGVTLDSIYAKQTSLTETNQTINTLATELETLENSTIANIQADINDITEIDLPALETSLANDIQTAVEKYNTAIPLKNYRNDTGKTVNILLFKVDLTGAYQEIQYEFSAVDRFRNFGNFLLRVAGDTDNGYIKDAEISYNYIYGDSDLYDTIKTYKYSDGTGFSHIEVYATVPAWQQTAWYLGRRYIVRCNAGIDWSVYGKVDALPTESDTCVLIPLTYGSVARADADGEGNDIATTYAPLDSPAFTTAVSMGRKSGTTVGIKSIAIGNVVTASGSSSQAFGQGTVASGNYSHAEGDSTTASGFWAHAEGSHTTASGNYAHAEGYYTTALQNQHAQGHYNSTSLATANSDSGTSTGTAFVIGNGTSSTASNAFRVTGKGATYAKEAYNATGADYAEYAEWADGNPNNEDRRGYFVTFDEDKPAMIRKANAGDWVLGVVSGNPCIIGNSDECWRGQYVYDEFGGIVYEDVEETYIDEETGEEKTRIINQYKLNPEYDASKEYIHRENRQEWDAVGWIGVLAVRDDGTCTPAGYCKVADGGTATAAERGIDTYRVLERVSENIVKIVVK